MSHAGPGLMAHCDCCYRLEAFSSRWQYKIKTASCKRRTPGLFNPIMPNSMVVLKGTHVIVNYEHRTRVKLEHDNGHKSIICSGSILNEPIVDAEKVSP